MSWIFSPSSPLATRVHRYRAEGVVPRIAVAFAVGITCGLVFRGLPESSNADVATKPAASYAASFAKKGVADKPATPASAAPGAQTSDTNVGGASETGRQVAAAARANRPVDAEAAPLAAKAAVALTPVPMPVGRPALAGGPAEHEEVKQAEPAKQAEPVKQAQSVKQADINTQGREEEEVASLRPADTRPEAKPAKRTEPKRAQPRARAKPSRDADRDLERDLESEGLRYVGTRVMPDGSRVPVYRRVESRRSGVFGFWDRDDDDLPRRRIRLFN